MTVGGLRPHFPVAVAWLYAIMLVWVTVDITSDVGPGHDAHAYWRVWQVPRSEVYATTPGYLDAFNYSPAFAQAIWPLAQLPWPVFGTLWSLGALLAFVYMLSPLGWRLALPLVLCCAQEIVSGNIFWVLALVVVASARPGAGPAGASWWSVVLLTKVTPALGPLWYALRRQWPQLACSVGATLVVVAVSAAVSPDLWRDWTAFLLDNAQGTAGVGSTALGPLAVRLPIALALLGWGALTDRVWTLPLAMALATPVAGPAAFTMLAAIPRLRRPVEHREPVREPVRES
ncbi:DUF2029 domain-containing protein [Nocardioides oleivorans]|uniref:DUF2029 domain-containing protein n=1 Tax=Nocardioides oleivorans TaxID=273676 RepID=A0A4Q2S580_9ACTN|nr:glycosyltransferase family 87 protein [Nocardioides oleivorans]RYB95509.1 DUF2029 domain-containing protein [Nocardioides oleivorans]